MSASERLRALVLPENHPGPPHYATQNTIDGLRMTERVMAALPLIADGWAAVERLLAASDEAAPEIGEFPLDAWLDVVEANQRLVEHLEGGEEALQ